MARGPGGSAIGRGPGGSGRSAGGRGGGKGIGADSSVSDGRKTDTKICPTCHGSGRVPSGKTGSVKGKPDRVKRPGARSMKKPAAKSRVGRK